MQIAFRSWRPTGSLIGEGGAGEAPSAPLAAEARSDAPEAPLGEPPAQRNLPPPPSPRGPPPPEEADVGLFDADGTVLALPSEVPGRATPA